MDDMIKGIYFSQIDTRATYQGAVAKVYDQIKAFERSGFEMRHVNFVHSTKGLRSSHIGKGICAAIPFTCVFSRYKYDSEFDGFDFYYFRFEAADYPLILFLKKLRKNNSEAKILIEFPDYPNTTWMNSVLYFPLYLKDLAARGKYKRYIDRFVVLNPKYTEIYGVPTITYMNGIDVARIPANTRAESMGDRIDVIGIGTMFPVHGFERFIESMADYYDNGGKRNIVFHIVGKGPGSELKRYMTITEKTGMNDHVIFEGQLIGEELTSCYNVCTLAIEQLALYRKQGLQLSSSLKSREYLARGIPIVSGCDIDILLGKDFKYWLRFPNDESSIDMEKVIDFYDGIYSMESRDQVISNIRSFAEKNCTYESTMHNVISYICNNDIK